MPEKLIANKKLFAVLPDYQYEVDYKTNLITVKVLDELLKLNNTLTNIEAILQRIENVILQGE